MYKRGEVLSPLYTSGVAVATWRSLRLGPLIPLLRHVQRSMEAADPLMHHVAEDTIFEGEVRVVY